MKPAPAKRRRKKDPSTKREKEIKDKLKKLNPSLYNRTTGGKLKNIIPGKRKPSKVVPGGPFIPGKGPKFSKPMKKFNLGGEAQTGLGRATVRKSQNEAQRKRVDDMLKRLYGPKIKPKPKPKKPLKKVLGDKIKPRLKKKPLKKRLKGG